MTVSKVRRWEILSEYFNECFKFTGDRAIDKTRLAGKYGSLLKEAKKENNNVRKRAMEEVAKIIKSMME
jgi:hypothetical protein